MASEQQQDREIRWGILGPGGIAGKVIKDFPHVPHARAVAVASRSRQRAEAFAAEHGLPLAYGSYRELIMSDEVDALYIATPHPQHRDLAIAAAEAGKAVLVEKSFAATVAGARQMITAVREHGVFAMEAMWTRFQPAIVAVRELVDAGAIGEVRQIQADLGVNRPYDPADRLYDPAQGGGAVLDLGVYVVSLTHYFLGRPDTVTARGSLAPTGVDADAAILLGYDDGQVASLITTLKHQTPGAARLTGTEGWIDILPRFHHPSAFVITKAGQQPERIERPQAGGGYCHELIEVTEGVRAGRTESSIMPLDDTLAVQETLEEACRQLGVTHHEDDHAL